jgi:hypothetical protein
MGAVFLEVEEREFWSGQILDFEVFSEMVGMKFVPIARDSEYSRQYNVTSEKKLF